jgi:integrase
MRLLYAAGLRVSEACGLHWRNLRPRGLRPDYGVRRERQDDVLARQRLRIVVFAVTCLTFDGGNWRDARMMTFAPKGVRFPSPLSTSAWSAPAEPRNKIRRENAVSIRRLDGCHKNGSHPS